MTRPLKAAAMDGLRQPVFRNRTGSVEIGDGIRTKSTLSAVSVIAPSPEEDLAEASTSAQQGRRDPVFGLPNVAIH